MPYIGVSPQFGVRRKHTYTATAGQTSFSGAGSEGATLSYTDSNFVDVYQNGVKLGDADYTSTSGAAIVLAQGASVDDLVEIIVFDAFSAADTVSKANGGTFDGNVTMGGTLGVTGKTGIGTSSPAAAFHVQTTTDGTVLSGDDIYVARFQNQEATTDRSFGVDIQAGSSTTDQALRIKDHDGTNTLMIVDGVGHVTKPNQSACLVFVGSTVSNLIVGNTTIAFTNVIYDQNSDFDTSNYQFVAPVTGKYLINFSLYAMSFDAGANYVEPYINTSNRSYYTATFDPDNGDGYDVNYFNLQGSTVADMDANDVAKIIFTQGGGNAQVDLGTASFISLTLLC